MTTNKKIKAIAAALLAAAMSVSMLAGCSDSSSEQSSTNTSVIDESVTPDTSVNEESTDDTDTDTGDSEPSDTAPESSEESEESQSDIKDVGADYVPTSEDDFEYELNSYDNTVKITEYTGKGTDIKVPKEIEGYPVSEFCIYTDNNFSQVANNTVKSVTIPLGVNDTTTYYYLTALETYTTYSETPQFNFNGCAALKEVNYINTPNTSTLPNPYFSHCTSLKNITFNFDIEIPEDAFYNCTSLEGIEVNGIIGGGQIGNYAFQNCTSLKSFDTDKLED